MPPATAYLNGQFLPFAAARLPVWDYAVVQGATVTDMVRTFSGEPFRLEQHLRRFAAAREALGIDLPENDARLAEIVREILARTRPLLPEGGDCGVLMFATPGPYSGYTGFLADDDATLLPELPSATSARPTLCVHPFTLAFQRFHIGYGNGVALAIPSVRQTPEASLPPGVKHRSRLVWYLAEREARSIDKTASALLLDEHGCVTETNTGNLFIVRDGHLFTPRAETTLGGVSQEFVMELARAAGLSVQRVDLTPEYVLGADEVFLTSTTYCLMPVTRLDNRPIGNGLPGPVFQQLFDRWSEAVGLDLRAQAESLFQSGG